MFIKSAIGFKSNFTADKPGDYVNCLPILV
jgi:hypothetical protein